MEIKYKIMAIFGTIGSIIAHYLGGWDTALQTLILFMAVDYITGLIVAGVFHSSDKSTTGALESNAGFRGLFKKAMVLVIILIATQIDIVMSTEIVRNAVIIAYIANESISIIENAGIMGVPIPSALKNAIEVLQKNGDDEK